jgi:hypothetical protein
MAACPAVASERSRVSPISKSAAQSSTHSLTALARAPTSRVCCPNAGARHSHGPGGAE